MRRRMNTISKTLAVTITTLCSPLLHAQAYPAKPVKFMVGFAAGGAADITARMLAPKLSEMLGQQFFIENRGGSGGMLGTDAAAKSAPDGYTLLLMPAADTVQPAVRRKLPYDLERDFTPVSRVVYGPWFVVIHPSVPARSAKEFVALARKNPGKLNYATSGIGSSAHMAAELFNSLAKVEVVHVPYKRHCRGCYRGGQRRSGYDLRQYSRIAAATQRQACPRARRHHRATHAAGAGHAHAA